MFGIRRHSSPDNLCFGRSRCHLVVLRFQLVGTMSEGGEKATDDCTPTNPIAKLGPMVKALFAERCQQAC